MSDRYDDPNLCKDCPAKILGEEYVNECFSSRKYSYGELCAGKYYYYLALRRAMFEIGCSIILKAKRKLDENVSQEDDI